MSEKYMETASVVTRKLYGRQALYASRIAVLMDIGERSPYFEIPFTFSRSTKPLYY